VKTTWNKCCEKAGVTDAHIHDIRHKGITDMGKMGYSLQEIAKAAGHRNISTTMRYTHLRAEDTKEAFEALGRRIVSK
jgi:integrase